MKNKVESFTNYSDLVFLGNVIYLIVENQVKAIKEIGTVIVPDEIYKSQTVQSAFAISEFKRIYLEETNCYIGETSLETLHKKFYDHIADKDGRKREFVPIEIADILLCMEERRFEERAEELYIPSYFNPLFKSNNIG